MLRLGTALGLEEQAAARVAALRARIDRATAIARAAPPTPKPRVAFLEWTDPFFCGGHWTPEIIALAGGSHPLNEAMYVCCTRHLGGFATDSCCWHVGRIQSITACCSIGQGAAASRALEDAEVEAMDPDWVVVCPCGFDIPTTLSGMDTLEAKPWWYAYPVLHVAVRDCRKHRHALRAHREGRVVVVDGNQMFNRPGPRLVDALEFLVGLLHNQPEVIPQDFPWQRYELPTLEQAQQRLKAKGAVARYDGAAVNVVNALGSGA